jgi:long-chain acyl-CoA synthetase
MSGGETNSLFKVFEAVAKKRAHHTAVIYLGTRYSYLKLKDWAEGLAVAMLDKGGKPGDRILLYIPHGIQWVVVWLGIQKLGGVAVPITPIYTPYDLKFIANDSGAETIVCADTNFGYVKKVLPETQIKRIIVVKMSDLLPWWKRLLGHIFDVIPKGDIAIDGKTSYLFKDLLSGYKAGDFSPEPRLEGEKIVEILYTGGTTKSPKGVPINAKLFLSQCQNSVQTTDPLFARENNILLCGVPLFHILGQTLALGLILAGGTVILHPRATLDSIFVCIQRFRAKSVIGVPIFYRMVLEHRRVDQYDLGSVECWMSAGDVLPVEVGRRFYEKFGKYIYQAYGTTETGGGVTACPVDILNPPKSAGRILPNKKYKLVDPLTLESVRSGEPGELLVSSEDMPTSYLNKPEETRRSFIELDGEKWYRTGDIVSVDEEGNFFFVDRTVDTIKHKGYRISSSEVEATLQEHPAVIGACVVGVPDPSVGERIKAFVVLKEDIKGITGYDLIKWCRERLVPYKIPQYIEFRDMLPKSKVGKLLRRELRTEELKRFEKSE